jgi:transposase
MFEDIRYYVGLDVHEESIAIAVAQGQSRDEPRFIGTTGYSVHQICKALNSLRSFLSVNLYFLMKNLFLWKRF